mmetsp:Transcript_94545/g.266942  ORF Transcript_94545/g.266942 Transcript_94545/m.266942 type:complete len:209 (+) Transcript_94545:809-1435(+)
MQSSSASSLAWKSCLPSLNESGRISGHSSTMRAREAEVRRLLRWLYLRRGRVASSSARAPRRLASSSARGPRSWGASTGDLRRRRGDSRPLVPTSHVAVRLRPQAPGQRRQSPPRPLLFLWPATSLKRTTQQSLCATLWPMPQWAARYFPPPTTSIRREHRLRGLRRRRGLVAASPPPAAPKRRMRLGKTSLQARGTWICSRTPRWRT